MIQDKFHFHPSLNIMLRCKEILILNQVQYCPSSPFYQSTRNMVKNETEKWIKVYAYILYDVKRVAWMWLQDPVKEKKTVINPQRLLILHFMIILLTFSWYKKFHTWNKYLGGAYFMLGPEIVTLCTPKKKVKFSFYPWQMYHWEVASSS